MTGSPYKRELSQSLEKISNRKNKVGKIPQGNTKKENYSPGTSKINKKTTKGTPSKRKKKTESSSSSSDSDESFISDDTDEESEDEEVDAECMIYFGLFSEDTHGEQRFRCLKCYKWGP